jgi:hypothetical protein
MSSIDKLKLAGEAVNDLLKNQNVIAEESKAKGYAEGRKSGLADGKHLGFGEGSAAGFEIGRLAGIEHGKKIGHQDGYEIGLHDGKHLSDSHDKDKALVEKDAEIEALKATVKDLEKNVNPGKKYSQDELDLAVAEVKKELSSLQAEIVDFKSGVQGKLDAAAAKGAEKALEEYKAQLVAEAELAQ